MPESQSKVTPVDPVWSRIEREAEDVVQGEPLLGGLVHQSILHHSSFERALSYRVALKLASGEMPEQLIREIADEAYAAAPELAQAKDHLVRNARIFLTAAHCAIILTDAPSQKRCKSGSLSWTISVVLWYS